jgi:predicted unusual protein kinase regulating ubiquinone biosynthesis (AarF/ABC1/UbiB family)
VIYRFVAMMYPALDPKPVVDELRSRITEELDYAREARNQQRFHDRFAGHPFAHVPRVFHDYSTSHVLTSALASGRRFAEAVEAPYELRQRWSQTIYHFVFSSILGAGMFNGDPHPGNYLFHDDGGVTFLDFGCVKYFPREMLADWKQLVMSYMRGDPELFREKLIALDFLRRDSTLPTEKLMRYFSFFWQPFIHDREFEFTREYNSRSLGMVFAPGGEFEGLTKQLNMPAHFVFVNRIQWGVYSILGKLGARANFHRMHREYLALPLPETLAP